VEIHKPHYRAAQSVAPLPRLCVGTPPNDSLDLIRLRRNGRNARGLADLATMLGHIGRVKIDAGGLLPACRHDDNDNLLVVTCITFILGANQCDSSSLLSWRLRH
jgi:hypothetical protein